MTCKPEPVGERETMTDYGDLIAAITTNDAGLSVSEFENIVKRSQGHVDDTDGDGKTPLHHAAQMDNFAFVEVLLKHGANPSPQDGDGNTALHHAAKNNDVEMVRSLFERGAVVNVDNKVGFPPLHAAVQNGNVECMRALLERGGDVNKRYEMFNTVFHEIHCVKKSSVESLELLLKFGADVEVRDVKGMTALHSACQNRNYSFVEKLLDYGAEVNAETTPRTTPRAGNRGKYSVLRYAVMAGDVAVCRLLLERGAEPNSRDLQNVAPLHVAAQNKLSEVVRCLLEHGADVSARNNAGQLALHIACVSGGDTEMIRLLLRHGADPNCVSNVGEVPLQAVMWKYRHTTADEVDENDAELKEKLLILLNHGAHFNLRDDAGDPYSIAKNLSALEKLPKSLKLVLEAADSVDIHGDAEMTPPLVDDGLKRKLTEMTTTPQPLKRQTRKCIRSLLGQNIGDKIETLPLPQYLNNYVLFRHEQT